MTVCLSQIGETALRVCTTTIEKSQNLLSVSRLSVLVDQPFFRGRRSTLSLAFETEEPCDRVLISYKIQILRSKKSCVLRSCIVG